MKTGSVPPQYDLQHLKFFTAKEADIVSRFFAELKESVKLSKKDRNALVQDFEDALLYYISIGVPVKEGLSRLDIANLGNFYLHPPQLWFALDDGAKIYPLVMGHGYMAIFRLSVYLKKKVVPEILQMALNFTIKRFPSFGTTIKKGFFWHYLDATKRRYTIEPETGIPCKPLKVSRSSSQSFRVLYYGNRISVEYFHIITDGTGGMVFLKTLTAEYLRLLGVMFLPGDGVLAVNSPATLRETANELARRGEIKSASAFVEKPALQFSGKLTDQRPCSIIHFKMDAVKLKEAARNKNATVTAYLLSLMFAAGKQTTDEYNGDFNIQVPVNMRKYYPSDTVRNFFMYCGIRIPISEIGDIDSMLPEINKQLREKSSKDAMSQMMNSTRHLVKRVRHVPLFLKEPAAKLIYGLLGDKVFSSVLSNLGVVTMPSELAEHIEGMDFVLGTALTNRASCSMVTFGNTATLSIAKSTADPSFENSIYDLLKADGILPIIEGSEGREY
ncbi:MAG: hypothetical protein Q4C00_03365 [Bacillota bacterium]|nr:hypothetical protein [Bacillota bacterium]